MEAIIAGFADNIEYNEYGAGQSDGQSGYIYGVKGFVLTDASYGDPDEILPHMF